MAELINEDGDKVEAFTQEEVDKQLDEAVKTAKDEATEEAKAEAEVKLEELKTTVEDLKATLEEKEEDIKALGSPGSKGYNFRKLEKDRDEAKAKKEEAEQKLAEWEGKMDEKVAGITKKIDEKKTDDAIKAMSGGDEELFDKIKFHFNSFGPVEIKETDPLKRATREKEIFNGKIENAFILATGSKPVNPLTGQAVSSGGGFVPPQPVGDGKKLSEDGKAVASKLGVSDKELKERGHI